MIALLTLSAALAGEQHLQYDLVVNGATVGTREVTVRYLDRPSGERRIVESVTKLAFAGQDLTCRAVGQSSRGSATFSSQTQLNGKLAQYQGVYTSGGGWALTLAGGGEVQTITYKPTDPVLTSLDLVDPGRASSLAYGGKATLFFVETADTFSGTLGGGTAGTLKVGSATVPTTTWTLAVDGGGTASFALDQDGLLLRSEVTWLGVKVVASLHELPAARDFGTVDIEGFDQGVQEQGL